MSFLSLKLHCKCTAAASKTYHSDQGTKHKTFAGPLLTKYELPHPIFNILILGLLFFSLFCSIFYFILLESSKISNLIKHSHPRASCLSSLLLHFYFICLDLSKVFNLIFYKLQPH